MKGTFKKLLASVLAASTVFSCAVFASAESKVKYGDVNADNNINSSDALSVLKHAVGSDLLEGSELKAADVSADGNINSTDALLVLQYAVGIINSFPAENPVPETKEGILALYTDAVSQLRQEVPTYNLVLTSKATKVDFSGSAMAMVPKEEVEAMKKDMMKETVSENKILGGTPTALANLPAECTVTDPAKFKDITCKLLNNGNVQIDITFKNEKNPKKDSTIVSMFKLPDRDTYEKLILDEMGAADAAESGMSMSLENLEYKNVSISCVIDPATGRFVSYTASYDTSSKLKTTIVVFDMVTDTTLRSTMNYSEFIYE